ncbi:N-acetyltransferase [Roseibium sp. HPY-6]|uniref:GNAT family N-acetyltransferase n=1 Tax=Roseibium sp. HPY-6 TaxID=3229852 RepID=UPI00338DBF00
MTVTIRPVVQSDLDLVCRHREEMFRSSGHPEEVLAEMVGPYRAWQEASLEDGSYFGFVAECDGTAVGGIGGMMLDWPPHPLHPQSSKRGYILNLFVEPGWRGQGIARDLMRAVETDLRARGLSFAILHATQQGRSLYEKSGWKPTSEMARQI